MHELEKILWYNNNIRQSDYINTRITFLTKFQISRKDSEAIFSIKILLENLKFVKKYLPTIPTHFFWSDYSSTHTITLLILKVDSSLDREGKVKLHCTFSRQKIPQNFSCWPQLHAWPEKKSIYNVLLLLLQPSHYHYKVVGSKVFILGVYDI